MHERGRIGGSEWGETPQTYVDVIAQMVFQRRQTAGTARMTVLGSTCRSTSTSTVMSRRAESGAEGELAVERKGGQGGGGERGMRAAVF